MFEEMNVWRGGSESGESIHGIGPSIARSPRAPKKEKRTKAEPQPQRLPGVILRYDPDRGFGFIGVRGKCDHFFHLSALADDSDTLYLNPGDNVEIETGTDRNGKPCATLVKLVD
ncbi:cold-shock protein [Paenibacillus wynnii]|uniref:CSD domain-containing protein n=1 Tax=Paenibacillus wynnii TaxID=268407 RepID=A0A098ME26_9BACL|nr:cold shock domain-containing protein [Paenibacillus wynnii]KGE20800.1 hypothetical protein PWYN_01060 [Paenibacillus wynnii]